MAMMFKLLEKELSMIYDHLGHVKVCAQNVETLAECILENDDLAKYTKEEIDLTKKFLDGVLSLASGMDHQRELIEKMQSKIINMYQ